MKAIYRYSLFLIFAVCAVWAPVVSFAQSNEEIQLANEYYNDGEFERALELYDKLFRKNAQVDFYASRIVDCYLKLDKTEEAAEFVDKIVRKQPEAYHMAALQGVVLKRKGEHEAADKLWEDIVMNKLKQLNDFYRVGSFFMQQQQYVWARKCYEQGRTLLKGERLFAGELAYLYAYDANYGAATREYLNQYADHPGNFAYIKSQILRLAKNDQDDAIERALLSAAQGAATDQQLQELLYEFYIETQNWLEALAQARSLDKLKQENGERVLKLAETLQNNEVYNYSNKALEYVIEAYPNTPMSRQANVEKVKNLELKVLKEKPVDTAGVREAVRGYDMLIAQFGRGEQLHEALYRKSRLLVFYLNDLKAAEEELRRIEALPLPAIRKAEAVLLMGDVLLLQGDYAQAKLKYEEIDDKFKDTQVGAQAKYKMAQLSYFRGEFEPSKALLGILKENTSNDIANDAIRLFLLIQDATGLDTSTVALETFARAQLLVYQKNYEAAMPILDSLLYAYPTHELTCYVLWEKASVLLNQNQFDAAIALLDKVVALAEGCVFADNALFTKAELYERKLNDKDTAQNLYFEVLTKFPSSLFKVEARKRIRRLRGETVN